MPNSNGAPEKIGVVVIDDNVLALGSVERFLKASGDFVWCGGVSDPTQALALVERTTPHVVLLDIDIPGADTFELLKRIVTRCPDTRVVMFSGFVHHDYVERALAAGAAGYIIKEEPVVKTIEFIRRAAGGECILSDAAADAFLHGA